MPAQLVVMTSRTRNTIRVVVAVLLITPWALYFGWAWNQTRHTHCLPMAQKLTCINNLKQIGLAIRTWAIDNDGRFPFNLSTNAGGTQELCARGSDGFDSNAAIHFQVVSNELFTPKLLVCPKDPSRKAAASFRMLAATNVTYRLCTGTNITEAGPRHVLVVCPIDGNMLYTDGSVTDSKGHGVSPLDQSQVWHTNL